MVITSVSVVYAKHQGRKLFVAVNTYPRPGNFARWQAAGFVHGMMNTDNQSAVGITLAIVAGNPIYDGIASVVIGIVLLIIAGAMLPSLPGPAKLAQRDSPGSPSSDFSRSSSSMICPWKSGWSKPSTRS